MREEETPNRGGRPKKRTRCPRCGSSRSSARAAQIHCQKPRLEAARKNPRAVHEE